MQSQCGSIILDSYAHSDLARGPNWGLHFDIQIVHTLARTAPTTWFQSTTFWPLDAKLYIYRLLGGKGESIGYIGCALCLSHVAQSCRHVDVAYDGIRVHLQGCQDG